MSERKLVRRDASAIYVDGQGGYGSPGQSIAAWTRLVAVLLVTFIVVAVFVHLYWGPSGVKMFGYIVGVVFIAGLVWAMSSANMNMFARFTHNIVRSTTEALIEIQVSDDRGEAGRIAAAIQGAHHDATMIARKMVNESNQLAKERNGSGGSAVPSISDLLSSQFGSGGGGNDRDDDDDDDDDIV